VLTLVVIALGAGLAYLFVYRREIPRTAPQKVSPIVRAARANLYGDRFNQAVFEAPGLMLTRASLWTEERLVDGSVNGISGGLMHGSERFRRTQNGFVRSYALSMLGGVVLVVVALLAVRYA